ncbi:spore germination protein GerPB [Paenibacillus crassostreae]|uniref:Uncharacterized protein n=1 Tax=Paenibacillus crassostreae TaxID=1763538 RepID=A0A167DV17_9BACL|nr:spore germination protein GerPB [Paenibacillus crassostreae]AOZ91028.1 hypothetical protein LPB68_01630 [Paenibacillus crassostreae]OAB74810.1 hypothetical protein PNBC_12325 [Paenibacillus crassostreae]
MNISVYQCVTVHHLKVGSISNSSILQIGTAGKINVLSHRFPSKDAKNRPLIPLPIPAILFTS